MPKSYTCKRFAEPPHALVRRIRRSTCSRTQSRAARHAARPQPRCAPPATRPAASCRASPLPPVPCRSRLPISARWPLRTCAAHLAAIIISGSLGSVQHEERRHGTSCLQIRITFECAHVLIRRPQRRWLATALGSPPCSSCFGTRRRTPHAKGSRRAQPLCVPERIGSRAR